MDFSKADALKLGDVISNNLRCSVGMKVSFNGFILLFFFARTASGRLAAIAADFDTCKAVDHESELGYPFDQSDLNWCSLATTADLLAFKIKLKPPDKISLLGLSRVTFLADPKEIRNTALPRANDRRIPFRSANPESTREAYISYQNSKINEWGDALLSDRAGYQIDAALFGANRGLCLDSELPSSSISDRNGGVTARRLERELSEEVESHNCSVRLNIDNERKLRGEVSIIMKR